VKPTEVAARVTEDDITAEVLRRLDRMGDDRLRRIMMSLIQHLHHFVKNVELTERELDQGIRFLTATGQMCTETRQEFRLLADTLGVSMVVNAITHRTPDRATESTIVEPFSRERPALGPGARMAPPGAKGTPTVVSGRVLDVEHHPVGDAVLDAWLPDGRQKCRTDKEGRFVMRTIRPAAQRIPSDGPVGALLLATDRHPWRPAHVQFVVSAPGFEPLTTHVFDSRDDYLESDPVFAVKPSLVGTFVEHTARDQAAGRFGLEPPFCTLEFDFVLRPLARTVNRH
jgi:protocatechuate 3,4-dioxygenase beta subunit